MQTSLSQNRENVVAVNLYKLLVISVDIDVEIFNLTLKMLSNKTHTQDYFEFLCNEEIEKNFLFDNQLKLNSLKYNLRKIVHLMNIVKEHDFNRMNYSTEKYKQTRIQMIKRISNNVEIIECLKFFVRLTAIDEIFIQCGSNSLNLLVEMQVDLDKQNWRNIRIKNTSLFTANFTQCDFSGSCFENINMIGVNLNRALLLNCQWKNIRVDELHQLNGHSNSVSFLCFSPDGINLASCSEDQSIRIWDVKAGKTKKILKQRNQANFLCFSPQGNLLAYRDFYGTLYLVVVQTGEIRLYKKDNQYRNGANQVTASQVCFSPDGSTIAFCRVYQFHIRLLDLKTGIIIKKLNVDSIVQALCFSPDGKQLASGDQKGQIILWDMETGARKLELNGGKKFINSFQFSPDGTTLTSGSNGELIRLWDLVTGKQIKQIEIPTYSSQISSFANLQVMASSTDSNICLSQQSGQLFQNLFGYKANSVCFSPDHTILASGNENSSINLFDVQAEMQRLKLNGHSDSVNSVCFSPDGTTLASGSWDKTVCLWDVTTGKLISKLAEYSSYVFSTSFSPDGTILASGSMDPSIHIQDIKGGKLKSILNGHSNSVNQVCFSPDGSTLASASWDKFVYLWDVRTNQLKTQLQGHTSYVYSLCFSPEGNMLASGGQDKSIRLWDVIEGKQNLLLNGHFSYVYSVCFSPDGNILASGGRDCSIILWDVKTGQQISKLDGHQGSINSVCFSPDGSTLASSGQSLRLWNMKTKMLQQELNGHSDYVCSVCFSSDGTKLASCSRDKPIRICDFLINEHQFQNNNDMDYLNCHQGKILGQILQNLQKVARPAKQISDRNRLLLKAHETIIFQGEFTNNLGMNLLRLLDQKGAIILEKQYN